MLHNDEIIRLVHNLRQNSFTDGEIAAINNVIRNGIFMGANAGGCWFCSRKYGEMSFDTEFDTYVHKGCLQNALASAEKYGYETEAVFMKYLLEE